MSSHGEEPAGSAARYPIRAVAKLTGLSIDTLRAWERRYGVVRPQRDGRGRLYSDDDVRRLLLLKAAISRGHAISRLASRSLVELEQLLEAPASPVPRPPPGSHPTFTPLVDAIASFDPAALGRELDRLGATLTPRDLVFEVILPLLQRVGDDWQRGRMSIAQEHMISVLTRNLLSTLVHLYGRRGTTARVLLATPSGERHELGLLAAALLTASGGLGVVYLGTDLPAAEIAAAARSSGVQVVVLAVHGSAEDPTARSEVVQLAQTLPAGVELWIGGSAAAALAPQERHVVTLRDFEELELQLRRLGARF